MLCAMPHTLRLTGTIGALGILASLCGCSGQAAAPPTSTAPTTFTASGTVDVPLNLQEAMKSGTPSQGQVCTPKASYDDVTAEKVQIEDAKGEVVGLGSVGNGTLQPQEGNTMVLFARCRLTFEVADVPDGRFFTVHVGDSSRQSSQFTKAELEAGASMSLGEKSEINN